MVQTSPNLQVVQRILSNPALFPIKTMMIEQYAISSALGEVLQGDSLSVALYLLLIVVAVAASTALVVASKSFRAVWMVKSLLASNVAGE